MKKLINLIYLSLCLVSSCVLANGDCFAEYETDFDIPVVRVDWVFKRSDIIPGYRKRERLAKPFKYGFIQLDAPPYFRVVRDIWLGFELAESDEKLYIAHPRSVTIEYENTRFHLDPAKDDFGMIFEFDQAKDGSTITTNFSSDPDVVVTINREIEVRPAYQIDYEIGAKAPSSNLGDADTNLHSRSHHNSGLVTWAGFILEKKIDIQGKYNDLTKHCRHEGSLLAVTNSRGHLSVIGDELSHRIKNNLN